MEISYELVVNRFEHMDGNVQDRCGVVLGHAIIMEDIVIAKKIAEILLKGGIDAMFSRLRPQGRMQNLDFVFSDAFDEFMSVQVVREGERAEFELDICIWQSLETFIGREQEDSGLGRGTASCERIA